VCSDRKAEQLTTHSTDGHATPRGESLYALLGHPAGSVAWQPPPVYPYEAWTWDQQNGWVNPDDDPATGTEEALLNEIRKLRR
jgi:hypothetical protein